jgi:hypothetical protein
MITLDEARTKILTELIADDPEVRASYLKQFRAKVEEFVDAMARAFLNWQSLDANSGKDYTRATVASATAPSKQSSALVRILCDRVHDSPLMTEIGKNSSLARHKCKRSIAAAFM